MIGAGAIFTSLSRTLISIAGLNIFCLWVRMEIHVFFVCASIQSEELCGDEGGEERPALHRDGPG